MAEETTELSGLPREPDALGEQVTLERIEQVARHARTIWLGLLGYLAFAGLTLFTVQDVDFFSAASETILPFVDVAIPITNFFWAAPWLGALLHAYLHLYLEKLWDEIADAPAKIGGRCLGDRIFPWLINDWALRRRTDRPIIKRPLGLLGDLITTLVVWLAAPLVIAAFWWSSMPAHLPWLTLMIAGALLLALYASLSGWRYAKTVLGQANAPPTEEPRPIGGRARTVWRCAATTVYSLSMPLTLAVLLVSSLARTEGTIAGFKIDEIPLAPIYLGGAEIVVKPDDWVSYEIAESRFRAGWCRDRELPADACEPPLAAYQTAARARWCVERDIENCGAQFEAFDRAFAAEWVEQRYEQLASLTRPDLTFRDLRRAYAHGAFLAGVDLRFALLQGTNLYSAQLEGALLSDAWLEGANLNHARLEGADLSGAELEDAHLFGARLDGANLVGAELMRANLRSAKLDGADLTFAKLAHADLGGTQMSMVDLTRARLEGANLTSAKLEGAKLRGAQLSGANLVGANLEGADLSPIWEERAGFVNTRLEGADLSGATLRFALWTGATLDAALAHSADFSGGVGLTKEQLEQVIGDFATVLPRDSLTKEQLHIWSCWEDEVADRFVETWTMYNDRQTADEVRNLIRSKGWICSADNPRRPVGTPAEFLAPQGE